MTLRNPSGKNQKATGRLKSYGQSTFEISNRSERHKFKSSKKFEQTEISKNCYISGKRLCDGG